MPTWIFQELLIIQQWRLVCRFTTTTANKWWDGFTCIPPQSRVSDFDILFLLPCHDRRDIYCVNSCIYKTSGFKSRNFEVKTTFLWTFDVQTLYGQNLTHFHWNFYGEIMFINMKNSYNSIYLKYISCFYIKPDWNMVKILPNGKNSHLRFIFTFRVKRLWIWLDISPVYRQNST